MLYEGILLNMSGEITEMWSYFFAIKKADASPSAQTTSKPFGGLEYIYVSTLSGNCQYVFLYHVFLYMFPRRFPKFLMQIFDSPPVMGEKSVKKFSKISQFHARFVSDFTFF